MRFRLIVAAAVLVSGAVHLVEWSDWGRHEKVVGPMFLLNVVAAVVIAAGLLLWRSWLPLFLAAGFGASTLIAFLIAATVGLFGVHEVWTGGYVVAAYVSEFVALLVGCWALHSEGWIARGRGEFSRRTTPGSRRADQHAT